MAQMIKVCSADSAEQIIQPLLEKGWEVKSMIAENVSVSVSVGMTGSVYNSVDRIKEKSGKIVFILEG